MRTDYFYWILNMTIAGTLTGLLVLLVGCVKKVPRRLIHWLWLVPAFRFSVPVSLSSRFSVMNLVTRFHGRTVPLQNMEGEGDLFLSISNYHQAAASVLPVKGYRYDFVETLFTAASWVWLAAVVLLLALLLWGWRGTSKELGRCRQDGDGFYRSNAVSGPVVFGLFRQKIAVPVDWIGNDGSDGKYVLMHEGVHMKRRDNLSRLLAAAIACVHWFNPFAWIFLKAFYTNLELSCDEAVSGKLDEDGKREYASVLLNQIEKRNFFVSPFGGAGVKGRIHRILSYKKLTGAAWLAAAAMVLAMAYAMITNGL